MSENDTEAKAPGPDPGNADPAKWTEDLDKDHQDEVAALLQTEFPESEVKADEDIEGGEA